MIDEQTRRALDAYIGLDKVRELSAEVANLAEKIELSAPDWEALEEEQLDRRARELAAAHRTTYDRALEFAADERPEIVRGKHNLEDRGEEELDRRAQEYAQRHGTSYEEGLIQLAQEEDKTIGL